MREWFSTMLQLSGLNFF